MKIWGITAAAAIIAALITTAYYYDVLLLVSACRSAGMRISFVRPIRVGARTCDINGLRLRDDEHGIEISARNARITFSRGILPPRRMEFDLTGMSCRMTKLDPSSQTISQADAILKRIIPFIQDTRVRGAADSGPDGIVIEKFIIENSQLNLAAQGRLGRSSLDITLRIKLRKDIIKEMPDAFIDTFLEDLGDQWRGLSLTARGNRSTPSLEISSARFKLTVREQLQNTP